jgi:hypothetical protein
MQIINSTGIELGTLQGWQRAQKLLPPKMLLDINAMQ